MTQTVSPTRTVTPRHGAPRPGRRFGARLWVVLVLLGLVAAAAVWLATGLLDASRVVQARAGEAQASLQQFRDSLRVGDREQARKHLAAGEAALTEAETAAQRRPVRVASALPYVGATVADLDHLLAAARIMTDSASDALVVYEDFAGQDSTLFRNSTFSLDAIARAQRSVAALGDAMDRAERELDAVTGDGPKGAEAVAKKEAALAQVESLRSELVSLGPLLDVLPAAVGADEPRTYLVTLLNQGEMRASGGAPLSVAFLRFDEGRMTMPLRGQTSVLTDGNQLLPWKKVPGNPWIGDGPKRFGNANINPDFTVSGEELARASKPHFGIRVDGVVALDVVAISHLLGATGPVESSAYGTLTAANAVDKLLVQAYDRDVDQDARHEANDQVMAAMLGKLTEGGGMIGKARALGKAVPGRHLQMYFRDPALQSLVLKNRAGGKVPAPRTGDLAAVYTQNGNGSKVDVFQHRTVQETVRLNVDGSADVRRTVRIENRTEPYKDGEIRYHRGYFSRWVDLGLINLLPPGAAFTDVPERNSSSGVDEAGRQYARVRVRIPPGMSKELTWEYHVPRAAEQTDEGLRLKVYADTQPLVNPASLRLTVVPPDGWSAVPGRKGWETTGSGATKTVPMDRARLLQLDVRR